MSVRVEPLINRGVTRLVVSKVLTTYGALWLVRAPLVCGCQGSLTLFGAQRSLDISVH